MKGVRRILVAVLICALALPLVVLLSWMGTSRDNDHEAIKNLIPVLPKDVRRTLPTFERDCSQDSDCDPPLGCFIQRETRLHMCLDSKCETDAQCQPDEACVPLKTDSGRAVVRLCSLVGARQEGERCATLPHVPEEGCARGLLCQRYCGRPCRLGDATSCPAGFSCSEGRQGPPSCLPTCEGLTCPEGMTCTSHGWGASHCARRIGPGCQERACPERHTCRLVEPPSRPWEFRTECFRQCDYRTPCPDGFFCHQFDCMKSCDPQAPGTCGPGLVCGRYHPAQPWFCIPG